MSADQLDFVLREQALVDAVQAQDIGVPLFFHQRPVVPVASHPEPVFGGIVQSRGQIGGVPHHFLRDTADVHAGAPQPARFDESHARTIFCRALGSRQATTAAADYHQIVLVGHIT